MAEKDMKEYLITQFGNYDKQVSKARIDGTPIELTWTDGYVTRAGGLSSFSGNGVYHKSDEVELKPNTAYIYYGTNNATADAATIVLYSATPTGSANKIEAISDNNTFPVEFTTPNSVCYARFTNVSSVVPMEQVSLIRKGEFQNKYKQTSVIIECVGDSVTEGMSTTGAHTSVYGASPYPAQLQKLISDNGYKAQVLNRGHGGERTNAVLSRLGAISVVTTEDLEVPSGENTDVLIMDSANGVYKIKTLDNNTYSTVSFSYTGQDVNPLTIDGRKYGYTEVNGKVYLRRQFELSEPITIKSGTQVFLSSTKNADVNIIFCGINDSSSETFAQWTSMLDKATRVSNKYIIIGSHSAVFKRSDWGTGETDAEKHADYKTKMVNLYGNHFLDLYDEWFDNAWDYASEGGYLTDLTEEQITSTKNMLVSHVIPSALTVNGNNGNVHLNEAGYYVLARLVFDRLKILQYI